MILNLFYVFIQNGSYRCQSSKYPIILLSNMNLIKNQNKMRCDRVLHTAMAYPGNYGYFPNTLSGDGDPLDVLIISEYPLYPGTIIKVKIIGVLLTTDEKGEDEKMNCCT